jgi:hypothetical protein
METASAELEEKVKLDLAAWRMFHTELDDERLRERLLAALVDRVHSTPTGELLRHNRTSALVPRRPQSENPILIGNVTPCTLHGVPEVMPI